MGGRVISKLSALAPRRVSPRLATPRFAAPQSQTATAFPVAPPQVMADPVEDPVCDEPNGDPPKEEKPVEAEGEGHPPDREAPRQGAAGRGERARQREDQGTQDYLEGHQALLLLQRGQPVVVRVEAEDQRHERGKQMAPRQLGPELAAS